MKPSDDARGHAGAADHPADEALLALSKLVLTATIRAGMQSEPSLSPTQIRTLSLLADGSPEGLSLSTVAQHLSASPPSASRICQRLVRDGLVSRAAGPGNEVRLSLSDAGVRVLARVNEVRISQLRGPLDALPGRRRRSAVEAITALVAHAGPGTAA